MNWFQHLTQLWG